MNYPNGSVSGTGALTRGMVSAVEGPKRAVILDDVARLSGVSRATASRALSNKPGVADDVRERVQTIARAMDYRPNRAAKNLAGAKTSLIALLLGARDFYRNPYLARVVDSMAKATEHFDQGLMLVMSEKEPGRAASNLIRDQIVDGVVLSAITFGEPWTERLIDSDMPTVLLGEHPNRTGGASVLLENTRAAERLVGHLLDTGCSRVGMILGPVGRPDAADRRAGYEAAHRARGRDPDPQLCVPGLFDHTTGRQGAHELLDRGVDAIFAANDMAAYGALEACSERGVDVPNDVSVAGFDGATEKWASYDLTTLVQPYEAIAFAAVEMLVQQKTAAMILEGDLHLGNTTRPATS